MPRAITGSIYKTRTEGLGIRWPEDGRDERQTGFRTRTEAREWFDQNVKPRRQGLDGRRVCAARRTVAHDRRTVEAQA